MSSARVGIALIKRDKETDEITRDTKLLTDFLDFWLMFHLLAILAYIAAQPYSGDGSVPTA
jgi:hypothetical protein